FDLQRRRRAAPLRRLCRRSRRSDRCLAAAASARAAASSVLALFEPSRPSHSEVDTTATHLAGRFGIAADGRTPGSPEPRRMIRGTPGPTQFGLASARLAETATRAAAVAGLR